MSLTPLSKTRFIVAIFYETHVYSTNVLKNFCTELHEEPKNGLVADNRLLKPRTDGWTWYPLKGFRFSPRTPKIWKFYLRFLL
jgi:hypothetical protein